MTARGSSPTHDLDSYCNEYGIPDRERAGLQRLVASLRREAAAQALDFAATDIEMGGSASMSVAHQPAHEVADWLRHRAQALREGR